MAFVGRERELARLAATLEDAAARELRRVAILGPAGVGSSSLLTELAARLASLPDVTVARGAAHRPLEGLPYAPLAAALEGALGRLPENRFRAVVGDATIDLAGLLPSLRARLLEARPGRRTWTPPDQRAARLTETVLGVLDRLAGDSLVVLVLEDLHWADPATRRFVELLPTASHGVPVCVVVSYRPEELHLRHPLWELAVRLQADPAVERLELAPLGRQELMQLAEARLGERPSGVLLAALTEGSRGVPLLAEQLLAVQQARIGIRLSDPFDGLVAARLAALSADAVRCLRALSAARRPVPRRLLGELQLPSGRISPAAVDEALRSGLAAALPAPVSAADAGWANDDAAALVGIVHDRYAEAIEALGLPSDRQPFHEALAGAMIDRPAEQAWHWEAAMRFAAARDAHVAAGESAVRLDPGATTLFHYECALELREAREHGTARALGAADLLVRAADAAAAAEKPRRAAALVQEAIDERVEAAAAGPAGVTGRAGTARAGPAVAGGGRGHDAELGALHLRLAQFRGAAADPAGALKACRQAVQLVPDKPTPLRARALADLAQRLMLEGEYTESEHVAEAARTAARAAGDEALAALGHATCTLCVDLGYTGRVEAGLALALEAADIARRTGRVDDLVRAYLNRIHLLLAVAGRRVDALSVAREAQAEVRRLAAEATYGALLDSSVADILQGLGRWREAEVECRAALERSPTRFAWAALLTLGSILVESRADEEAGRLVDRILLQLEASGDAPWSARLHRLAVSYALWRGDTAEALGLARRGWERIVTADDWPQVAFAAATTLEAAAAAAEAGRLGHDMGSVASASELGHEVLAALKEHAGAPRDEPAGATHEDELYRATALAHAARLQGRARADAWRRVADGWLALGDPYPAAKAHWWEAAAALPDRTQRARARTALQEAWRLALDLPARPLLRELARLAGAARIPLAGAADVEVAALLAVPAARRELVAVGPGPAADARAISGGDGPRTGNSRRAIIERLLPSPPTPVRDPFGLSPREYEVLAIIAEGRTNREIAERLFISQRTVGVHVRNILAKLGVAGRVEATSVAIRLGLVPGVAPGAGGRR